jgi:hypothetical protein
MDDENSGVQRAIFLGKVRRARGISPADKIADSAALFDETLVLMRDAIATDNPALTPDQVRAEVFRRLRIARRLDESGIYEPAGTIDDEP